MKVVIAGGSGLIGQALASALEHRTELVVLSRKPDAVNIGRGVRWDPSTKGDWATEVREADVVVNLAGASIADRRWTVRRKQMLRDSRIDSTRAIVGALGTRSRPGSPVLISASAIGYYGARGDEELDEESSPGQGFLSELSVEWEREAWQASAFARVVIPRIGIVLSRKGGALGAMLPIFRLGLGGPLGSGRQWMSWIHVDDLVRMIDAAMTDDRWVGPVNAVAPEPVTNRVFTRALGRAVHRPAIVPAPGFAVRLALGELAEALLLTGQRVVPRVAAGLAFEFRFSELDRALGSLDL